jgi:methionine sulfoxide reductase catalytic subunit
LEFPPWLRLTHGLNFLFLTLLIRSGIQILADHPRLYWNPHCTPGSEWLKLSNVVPHGELWTSMDEAVAVPPSIALPGGRHHLGIGRHWHFFAVVFWVLNGAAYLLFLFGTGDWRRLIPTSWTVFPAAWQTFCAYATLHLPATGSLEAYNPLQQLAYCAVVFGLAPLSILTGAAMSPAIDARFPWYPRLFGNRQAARSLHFVTLVAYLVFIPLHLALVAVEGFPEKMDQIVLGLRHQHLAFAISLGLVAIGAVGAIHVLLTGWSQRRPYTVQNVLGWVTDRVPHLLLSRLTSRQNYTRGDISPAFWVNGKPPVDDEWVELAKDGFARWRLRVHGLVECPLLLSLDELRALPSRRQITQHCCIQGWSALAEWSGVPLEEILTRCRVLPHARYLIFRSHQVDEEGRRYYGSLELGEARSPQTILAYEMNGAALTRNHGAPLRLRVETKLGFKMVKWLESIELVTTYRTIGKGLGGYREDFEYYGSGAEI